VREVTVHTTISAPREEVFDFVQDLAARPAITDHYLKDYRLARAMPVGKGAAARFKLRDQWAELAIREASRPHRIIEDLRWGRLGRNRAVAVWEFVKTGAGTARVELTTYSEPKTIVDRIHEIGAAGYIRRKTKHSLERLRRVFEEDSGEPLARATIAGYEPLKAARFGGPTGLDPARPRPGEPA
jgi:uncharacterized protein YndB with AHSA1/START domain